MKFTFTSLSTYFNVLQRTSTYFNVLQRTSTWLILCLLSFYLSSCRQDIEITPTLKEDNSSIFSSNSTKATESEINSIKEWFNNMSTTSNVKQCLDGRTFHPRWDKSKKDKDRIEFDIFENVNKMPFPKMKMPNAKEGRKRFVTKETNGNGNNRKGHIVSFVPSNSFTGNMDNLTTSNFRAMKFDGVLIFEELSGCFGSAYFIEKGVVLKKLALSDLSTLLVRDCNTVTVVTDWWQYSPSAGETRADAHYIGSSYSTTLVCTPSTYPNYDQDQAQGDYSGGGGGGDTYYQEYLSDVIFSPEQGGTDIASLQAYLKCLTLSADQSFQVSILVEEPKPGSDYTYEEDFGHAFVRFEINGIGQNFGFYPSSGVGPLHPQTSGKIKDNSGSPYNTSITFNVNAQQFENALTILKSWYGVNYNAYTANCTDFAVAIGNSLGIIQFPNPKGLVFGNQTSTPGRFGYAIRNLPNSPDYTIFKFNSDQSAPNSNGPCQ